MRCFLYRIYDRLKSTVVFSQLFYYGQKFQHFEPITCTGTVVLCEHGPQRDGDTNFDIMTEGQRFHCEVTPCQSKDLRQLAQGLELGEMVKVSGVRTYDPDHHFLWVKLPGGGAEIHPVTALERV